MPVRSANTPSAQKDTPSNGKGTFYEKAIELFMTWKLKQKKRKEQGEPADNPAGYRPIAVWVDEE